MTGIINWTQLRHAMLLSTHRIDFCSVAYWDKQAKTFNENTVQMEDLTQKQLNRLILSPECTVLDVGAGTGRITIPLAKYAKHVTALEPSANMMALLKANVQKENIKNIQCLHTSIEDVDATDIETHDIVLSSFSLLMVDVGKALLKMDALATKGVYVFLSASKWMDEEMRNIVYGEGFSGLDFPDHIYVVNILQELGISANVDIFNFQSQQCYKNLDDAVSKVMQQYSIPLTKQDELRAYLAKILVQDSNEKLWLYRKKKAALIWWTKNL
jgi:ubiquinone/menaquinone biosynthesis C-methylase UbiE